jgi:hypothetical protein
VTRSSRVLLAGLCGLAVPALMAWRELRHDSELSVALGLTPGRTAELAHADEGAWVLILGSGLLVSVCALVVSSWARTPVRVLAAGLGVTCLVVLAAMPIYWLTYRGAPGGLHISISPTRRYAASLEVLLSLVFFWLAGHIPNRTRVHAAAERAVAAGGVAAAAEPSTVRPLK